MGQENKIAIGLALVSEAADLIRRVIRAMGDDSDPITPKEAMEALDKLKLRSAAIDAAIDQELTERMNLVKTAANGADNPPAGENILVLDGKSGED